MEFPNLTGSEKQIAWATKVRQELFDHEMSALAKADAFGPILNDTEEVFRAKQEYRKQIVLSVIEAQTEAKWWIDRRNSGEVFKMTPTQYAEYRKIGK